MKIHSVRRAGKAGEGDVWTMSCHLQKTDGVIFYRIFEFWAKSHDEAEEKGLARLKDLAKRLATSRFIVVSLFMGRYDGLPAAPGGWVPASRGVFYEGDHPKDILLVDGPQDVFFRERKHVGVG